jgi:glycosyltransferase involved in cell wall biosynthesis
MISDLDIVYYGPEPWAGMWRNRHQLLSRLARANRVLYIEPRPFLRAVIRGLRRGVLRAADLTAGGVVPSSLDNLWLYQTPLYAAIGGGPLWRPLARMLRVRHLRQALRKLGMSRPVVWLSHPGQADARHDLPACLRIYHVVDEYLGYQGMDAGLRAWLAAQEEQIIAWADLIIAVTPELVQAKGRGSPKAYLLPNAADVDAFHAALAHPAPLPPGVSRPVLGYVGLISARLDLAGLAEVAARRPGWSWLLVGDVVDNGCQAELARLRALPNVHLVGARPANQIPAIVASFDVGLIPYRVNEETRHASPLKLYEYLAAGLPVVSSDIPAVREFAECVEIATGADEMEAAIERALREDSLPRRLARWSSVRGHSWDARVQTLSEILAGALRARTEGQARPKDRPGTWHQAINP